MSGTLFVIATPIGNLSDISNRAVEILQQVDAIACEDTRVSGHLLSALNITKKPLYALHKHNEKSSCDFILHKIDSGENIALISDAGTPLICDPGALIAKMALERNIKISPIPGACAAISALSVSGMPADKFYFAGFVPSKLGQKITFLESFQYQDSTVVMYETPQRIKDTLQVMQELYDPEREISICREITKLYEEIVKIKIKDSLTWIEQRQRGEFVLVLSASKSVERNDWLEFSLELKEKGLSVKDISKITAKYFAADKKEVYRILTNM